MNKQSYFYIGIACSIATLAIIQCIIPKMLPINLYLDIAWISLELTMLELFKSTIKAYSQNKKRTEVVIRNELNYCNRLLVIFNHIPDFSDEYKSYTEMKSKLLTELDSIKNSKRERILIKIEKVVIILQVTICFVQFPLMFIKKIPDNLYSDKLLGVLSLLSFALLIVSYYISSISEDSVKFMDEKTEITNGFNEYYISLFEKAMIRKRDNDSQ